MRLRSRDALYAGAIEVFDNAIPNADVVREYLDRSTEWTPARVGVDAGKVETNERNSSVTFFDPFSLVCPSVLRDFAATVWRYLDDYGARYNTRFAGLENVNVNRYGPGEFYKAHSDDGPGHNRVISALVYLNDVLEGGQTEFVHHDVSVFPKAGRLVIFPSNYAYAHAAHPPTSGVKYSAAFWTVRP
jgi:hypothetical protein